MAPPLLTLQDIHLTFGSTPLLEGIDLTVNEGERLCLVGRNGSGKSTILKVAAGLIQADDGTRFLKPGTTVRYLPQEPDLQGHDTVRAYVQAGLAPGDDPHRALTLLAALGLAGDQAPAHLSGGEARRAALARAMAPRPDILMLDEPTNHLDIVAIEWLEAELAASRFALVLISHDRRFLENLTDATVWIDRGVARRLGSGFGKFEAWRDKVLAEEETERHKLDRKIVAEEHWVRYGVTARRKRNMGRMRALADLRDKRRNAVKATGVAKLAATQSAASGKLVIEADGLAKSYDGRPVVAGFSTKIRRGDRVGIIGPNGAGKTTLIKLLTGTLQPDGGRVRLGTKLDMVTLDQSRDSLDATTTLSDALTGGGTMVKIGDSARHVIGYMKDFLFLPEQARTPISRLSGGERGRLMLARALASPSNLLVLDEPTNDLDLETLDLLQELLADYSGTVLLVSHDRDFIDRVATSVIASNGNGRWTEYAGGYSDMLVQRGDAPSGARPRRDKKTKPARLKPTAPRSQARAKLSFKDAHALKTLPGLMSKLETETKALNAKLADPDLYRRDPEDFAATSARLDAAQAELSASEEQWLDLEMKREAIEAG
ncbi:Bis-ABC ATPase Uup [hydrothermal vent metagenome]|uniref:Bis-ABC ATPase Uup n=1 Tax=hydrothermal vent metagenome TaxID=652676 RepID=A0A3B0TPA8_9ZZZZ